MKALVTGGSSFIESHIVERLCKKGYDSVILDIAPPELDIGNNTEFIKGDVRQYDLLKKIKRMLITFSMRLR